ncbi:cupin domain-containing protein [Parvularcula maris]|uniref:Cupin domain-containing protein n=1 Tax=Parvularcula maris TaxID=2965077 RepID=A0A9X2LAI5_9PROT|nr:cupin domain-containing protein [Parvularcula maris]MCQ8186072.1 cupin domain-containing protein [Parvularcula maris]
MLQLLLAASALLHPPTIVGPGEGTPVAIPIHPVDKLLSQTENEDGLTFYEFRVLPRSAGAPPHTHTHEDEFFYVVSGTVQFLNGEQVVEGTPGTFAALTRGHPHAFWNAGDEPAVMVVGVSNGKFETFFDALAAEAKAKKPSTGAEMGELIGRLAAESDIAIRMDLLPEEAAPFYAH